MVLSTPSPFPYCARSFLFNLPSLPLSFNVLWILEERLRTTFPIISFPIRFLIRSSRWEPHAWDLEGRNIRADAWVNAGSETALGGASLGTPCTYAADQGFSDFSMHWKPLKGLVTHRLLGPNPSISDSGSLGWGLGMNFYQVYRWYWWQVGRPQMRMTSADRDTWRHSPRVQGTHSSFQRNSWKVPLRATGWAHQVSIQTCVLAPPLPAIT